MDYLARAHWLHVLDVTSTELVVLLTLNLLIANGRKVQASHKEVSELSKLSTRSVILILGRLKQKGLLTIKPCQSLDGGNEPNEYSFGVTSEGVRLK